MKPLNRTQAEDLGYVVDSHCYPWIAYKGSRFAPTEFFSILTDLEDDRQMDSPLNDRLKELTDRISKTVHILNKWHALHTLGVMARVTQFERKLVDEVASETTTILRGMNRGQSMGQSTNLDSIQIGFRRGR